MQKDKIIIDVNVWISLIISEKLHLFSQYIFDNSLIILTCNELIVEFSDVINRKKIVKYLQNPPKFYIDLHIKFSQIQKINVNFSGSPDPKDDYLFDLAAQSGAKFLVTGDKKLLDFKFPDLEIITMNQFFEKF